ncbi:MAG: hypothetical protein HQL32_06750, partial [Planctomycetes bacterium]|nr:hypothetical protein [Planctomycetota bacterium]
HSSRYSRYSKGNSLSFKGPSGHNVILIPVFQQNWIIVRSSSEDIPIIKEWVEKLDIQEGEEAQQEMVPVQYVDVGDLAQRLSRGIEQNPGSASRPQVVIQALQRDKKILIFGSSKNRERIKKFIAELDTPSENTISETIEIGKGDPVEIVQVLKLLLAQDQDSYRRSYRSSNDVATSFKGPSLNPIVLIPMENQNRIIAKASKEDMEIIKNWIGRLDIIENDDAEEEMVSVQYVDVDELAQRLNTGISQQTGVSGRPEVVIQALGKSDKILIFGSTKNRNRIKRFIAELDVPTDNHVTEKFELEYADPDQLKEYLEELFKEEEDDNSWSWYRRSNESDDKNFIRVISNPLLKQLTVITTPDNIEKVKERIKEWDTPLNLDGVKPMILTLVNSDPEKMVKLLSNLFSESESSNSNPYWWYYGSRSQEKEKIVGALYGKLTFAAVPDTKKIIVISKVPEAYKVIKEIIIELDSEDIAELPMVIVLKYADAEELADQLNALFNERGTEATLRRRNRGLSPSSSHQGADSDQKNTNTRNTQSTNQEMIKPWWTSGRQAAGEGPISNLIGKVRFIPVHRSKAILVLSPPEYRERIQVMINELDRPGKQVLIKAIIMQVGQKDLQALGTKISSRPKAFGDIGENVLTGLAQVTKTMGDFTIGADINLLVDLLKKEANAKVLNQPLLWTMDNEEAEFFRGDRIAFKVNERVTDQNNVISDFTYQNVGATLRVRPNITPDNSVNMTISLEISSVDPELVNGSIAVDLVNTITRMNIKDGETVLLGGIVYKSDTVIKTGIPGIAKIPLLNRIFGNHRKEENNSELLVFITPTVIDEEANSREKNSFKPSYKLLEESLNYFKDAPAK